jgi:hypothetical protein
MREIVMKRGISVFVSVAALMAFVYFIAGKWAIHHSEITLEDVMRGDRNVTVEVSIRRDREMEAMLEMLELPVVVLSHGNTVKHTEYSFLTNAFAARGYMVVSIQHDLDTDDPMVTKAGEEYVGRRMQYNRGIFNILFAIDQLKKVYPNADYKHLTMVGHSNGGDISMYFAKLHPEMVKKVVTLDNLRVPFVTDGKVKILSFRSKDPQFKTEPGVIPTDEECEKAGIQVVRTEFQHNELSDRGSDKVKSIIESALHRFLDNIDDDDDNPYRLLHTPKPTTPTGVLAASTADAGKAGGKN